MARPPCSSAGAAFTVLPRPTVRPERLFCFLLGIGVAVMNRDELEVAGDATNGDKSGFKHRVAVWVGAPIVVVRITSSLSN